MKNKIILGAVIVIMLIAALGFGAFASVYKTDATGNYQYFMSSNKTVSLTKVLTAPGADFAVPETIDGYTVSYIHSYIFKVDDETDYSADVITVSIPAGVEEINTSAFRNCENIQKVTVAPDNQYLCSDELGVVFNKDKTSIVYVPYDIATTEYVIPGTVTSFYSELFPPKIETLTIPASVTKFSNMTIKHNNQNKVRNLIIEKFREDWPVGVFKEWYSLRTLTLGEQTEFIGDKAFEECGIREIYGGENVRKIGNRAFEDCGGLTTASFENVEEIGDYAFNFCKKLTAVPYGDKLKKMGRDAFSSCYALESVTIPASLAVVPESAFWNCDGLKELNIEYGCTQIDRWAFYSCKLTDIKIPGSVKTIGETAFEQQSGGKMTITFEEGVENIGKYAFETFNESYYDSIILPESIKTIGEGAFNGHGCNAVTIPKGCKSIGANAFKTNHVSGEFTLTVLSPDCEFDNSADLFSGINCYKVTIRAYPGSTAEEYVKNHPEYAGFNDKNGENSFVSLCGEGRHVPEKTCSIYTECKYCGEILMTHTDENSDGVCDICGLFCGNISVSFSGGVLTVYSDCENTSAYYEFKDITSSVIFADGVTEIMPEQFKGFGILKLVFIPDSVKSVGGSAFADCHELKTVILQSADTVIHDGAFENGIDLYAPLGYISDGADVNEVLYEFDAGVLYLMGSISSDMYGYMDMTAAFCIMFDGIKSVKIDSFEAIDFTVYTYDKEKGRFIRADKFDGVSFSLMVETDGGYTEVTYNELGEYLPDGKGVFYIVTSTEDGDVHRDTAVSISDRINETIKRILAAIVKLMNMLFAFFNKFRK